MDNSSRAKRPHIVLVHGAVMNAASWRPVFDRLIDQKFDVSAVQLPLSGLQADVAALQLEIERIDNTMVLVGHSYGGAVTSVASIDNRVAGLVYVAAHQPDVGESVGAMNEKFPLPAHVTMLGDSHMIVSPDHFGLDVAADLDRAESFFLAHSQTPTAVAAFVEEPVQVGWHDKPSHAVIATQDRVVSPDLQRYFYHRSGAEVIELASSHLVPLSHPDEVAAHISRATMVVGNA